MNSSKNGKSGPKKTSRLTKENLSWALYDWGNSAFACTVMAGFFPIFFKQYWSGEASVGQSTYYLGMANSLASLVLAFFAPILGALADLAGRKKGYLFVFCVLGVLSTAGLYFVGQGQWPFAIAFYVLATLGFAGGNIFYDALLPLVSGEDRLDFVSGLGFSLGYLGGGLLFAVNVVMTLQPHWFGLRDATQAVQISFLTVAIWWLVFALPLLKNLKEPPNGSDWGRIELIEKSLKQLLVTLKDLKAHPSILLFLLAYLFYIDGVNTIVKMAVDYGLSLGFQDKDLITALLITQFVGFPSAVAFGILGEKWSAKGGIALALGAYAGITILGYSITAVSQFYALACAIGLVQGGIQSLSRSHYARLVPKGQEAEYFGFFNMLGKFSAIIGPFLMGYVSYKTGSPRLSILVILVFFAVGGALLFAHHQKSKG